MRTLTKLALSAAGAALSVAAPAVAQKTEAAAPKRDLSKDFVAAIQPSQAALAAKDYATAATAIEAARARADNPDERYLVDRVAFDLANAQGDMAARQRAMAGVLASGAAPANEVATFNGALASAAYEADDYAGLARYAAAARAAGSTDPNLNLYEAQAYGKQKDYPRAIAAFQKLIDADRAAGKTPQEPYYNRIVQYAYQTGDRALLERSLQAWLVAYPTQKNWHDTLLTSISSGKFGEPVQLDYFRLLRASNALSTGDDWQNYAELASSANLNGEVLRAIDDGSAAGALNRADVQEVYGRAQAKQAEDRASLVTEAASAAAKADARPVANAANALMGYGDYAKAAELYKLALTKPGVDANEATLRLGIAQAMSGDIAAAKANFAKVTGERQPLATYWTVWADSRGAS